MGEKLFRVVGGCEEVTSTSKHAKGQCWWKRWRDWIFKNHNEELFDKDLASLKLQDYEQYVLSMEHGDANWILDFGVITHVSKNPKFLDEIKSVVGSSQNKVYKWCLPQC